MQVAITKGLIQSFDKVGRRIVSLYMVELIIKPKHSSHLVHDVKLLLPCLLHLSLAECHAKFTFIKELSVSLKLSVFGKGKYFGQKRPPGGNKFNLEKDREEIKLEKNNDNQIFSLFLMNFFPIFPFDCQYQRFLHNFMQNSEKFLALRAICSFFCAILCYKWNIYKVP